MTSIINNILQQECDKYTKQEQWLRTSKHAGTFLDKHERNAQLGKHFLSVLIIEAISGTTLASTLNSTELKNLQAHLLNVISCKYKYAPQKICHFVGSFFQENLYKIANFQQMISEMKTIIYLVQTGHFASQSQSNESEEQDFDETLNLQESQFLTNEQVSDQLNFNSTTDSNKNSNLLDFMNKDDDDEIVICDNQSENSRSPIRKNVENKQIQNYLIRVGGPANEITYIAQHCNMRLADYTAKAIGINKFETTVNMQFKFDQLKIPKTNFTNKCVTKGKKSGKYLAALLLLRDIYTIYPQFWEYFTALKQQRNIILPMDSDNSIILAESEKQPQIQEQKNQEQPTITPLYEKTINEFMQSIKSYKAESNYLMQQIKGITLSSKKIQDKNLWIVQSDLVIQMNGTREKITEELCLSNSKKAEQQNIKALLTKLYLKYPTIWNKWKAIKQKKGLYS